MNFERSINIQPSPNKLLPEPSEDFLVMVLQMRQRIGNGPKFRVQRTRKCGGRKWWEGDECLAEWYSDPVHHPTGAAQHHVKCLGRSWAVPAYTLDVVFYSFCFNGICHNPSQSQYNHNSHTYQATIGSSTVGWYSPHFSFLDWDL